MSEVQLSGLIRGVLLPALVAGTIYLIARFSPGVFRQTLRSAGVAAGVTLAFVLLVGAPSWSWGGSPGGILMACLLGSLWPMIESQLGRRIWVGRFVGLAIVTLVVLRPFLFSSWSAISSVQVLLTVISLGAILWMVLDRASAQMHTAGLVATLVVMTGGAAVVFLLEGSASLGQLSGALGATLGACGALSLSSFLRPGRSELNGVYVLIFVAMVLAHGFFVETDWFWNLWIMAPAVYLLVRGLGRRTPSSAFKDAVISAAISLVPVAYALLKSYQRLA